MILSILILAAAIAYAMRTIRFVCWFSQKFYDIHDYPTRDGGDGIPSHFHEYRCWNCGNRFTI